MSGEDEAVSTYAYFRDEVLPRIKKQGYTAIQLMAVQVGFELGTFGVEKCGARTVQETSRGARLLQRCAAAAALLLLGHFG
jgi:hypothetical protein